MIDSQGRFGWASKAEANPWVRLNWAAPQTLDEVAIYPGAGSSKINQAALLFSDGSNVPVETSLAGTAPVRVSFSPRTVS